jgi:PPOX class probable F420-dependent enzyme
MFEKREDMIELSAHLQQLLQKRVVCSFATLMPDGSPQLTQTWVDTDGTYILINSVEGHQKVRNVRRDQGVMVSVLDPDQWQSATTIRGRVVEITREGADLGIWQGLVVRYDVACLEWSRSSQSSIQGCPQSLSASLVTVGWKARGNAQGSVSPEEATG